MPSQSRVGSVTSMLHLLQPLDGLASSDPITRKRRLLADLCRLIGDEVHPNSRIVPDRYGNGNGNGNTRHARVFSLTHGDELPPRLQQTLRSLLAGDSEKQVARRLNLS